MAVTTSQIRDLLNRPRGLNEGMITEMITIREAQVNKVARGDKYGIDDTSQVTTTLKDSATKMLVCMDCLLVLVDTVPAYYSEDEQSVYDRRFQSQIEVFEKRAQEALALISDSGISTFATGKTKTRLS